MNTHRGMMLVVMCASFAFSTCGGGGGDSKVKDPPPTPKWDSQAKQTASDAADGDRFGGSVSISGDYAIVGAYSEDGVGLNRGAAYIYHRTADNAWGEEAIVTASDAADDDGFGRAVSISGDYAIVNAWGVGADSGAVYIYHRTGGNSWGEEARLTATDAADGDYFGYSVSLSGDFAVVGARGAGADRGAVYIYHRTGGNIWAEEAKLTASDAADNDNFGYSVSISGDYAIVGATGVKDPNTGAAYIYRRTGVNAWGEEVKLTASDAAYNDYFGNAVAISGDYAVVCADYEEDDTSPQDRGAAYVFRRTGTNTWIQETKLIAGATSAYSDYFGISTAISGDYVVVGAYGEDEVGINSGAAYIFHRTGGAVWDTGTRISASDKADWDSFGVSVSISGEYVIVGAYGESEPGLVRGAAYFFK